jgi:putative nucleotidyltransferase with HDIG domain
VSDSPSDAERSEAALREAAEGREVRVINDEEEALSLIDADKTEIVFSHLSSGPLASSFFLNEVWKRNPKSARFLLDAVSDSEALVRCVLSGHQFIQTPLDTETLKTALERAESLKRFLRNDRIQSLISRMRTLPPRPSIYPDVLREVRSSSPSAMVVAELVAKDLAVSTKLLQLVNSPYYAVGQPILDVKEAVLFLGLETTVAVVLSIETFAKFDKLKPLYFSADRVWKHSQVLADLAMRICRTVTGDRELCGQAYLAGLLHDIGELALAENFGEEYQNALNVVENQDRPLFEVELELFGATHADTGAYLLALWGVPIPVVEAVASHHAAAGIFNSAFSVTAAVHAAEQLLESADPIEDILTRYTPELGLREHIEQIKRLLPTEALKSRERSAPAVSRETPPVQSRRPESNLPPGRKPDVPKQGRFAKLFGWHS